MQALLAAHPHVLAYFQQGLRTFLLLVVVTALFGPPE